MATTLLPEIGPEIDANPASSFTGGVSPWTRVGHDSIFANPIQSNPIESERSQLASNPIQSIISDHLNRTCKLCSTNCSNADFKCGKTGTVKRSCCLNCDQVVLQIDCATHAPILKLPRVRTTRFKSSFINYAVDHYV